jgi:hypothetical protein
MPLKLPADLALDLHAFCEVHYDAPQSHVIYAALRHFIEAELKEDQVTKARFDVVRERLETSGDRKQRTGEPLRLVETPTRSDESTEPVE